MKTLFEILEKKEVQDFTKHPRFKVLDEIYKRVNYDREQAGYKKLPMKVFAIKTSHLSMDDLGFLLKRMQQSPFPGKVFFGSLKVKTSTQKPPTA